MLQKIKILLLASDPYADDHALRIDREARTIRRAIERSRHRDRFELVSEWAVTVDELQHLLLKHEPQIVHFAGHADRSKGLLLTNVFGDEFAVDHDALCDLFDILKRFVRMVVLNACETLHIAETLQTVVDYSIGMAEAITDPAANAFSDGFYGALASGATMDEAFRLGCNSIRLAKLDEWRTPRLLVRDGVDPTGRLFVPPEREPLTRSWVEALESVQRLHDAKRIEAYASLRPHVDADPEATTAIKTFLLDELARAGTQIFAVLEELAKWLPARSGAHCTPSNLLALEILPEYAVKTIKDREEVEAEGFTGEYPLLAMPRDTLQRNAELLIEWLFHPAMPMIYRAGDSGDRGAKTTRAGLIATWATILGTSQPQSVDAAAPDEVLMALVAEIRGQTSGAGGVETRAALTAYWEEMKADHARLAKLRAWSERARRRGDLRRRDSLQTLLDRFRTSPAPAAA